MPQRPTRGARTPHGRGLRGRTTGRGSGTAPASLTMAYHRQQGVDTHIARIFNTDTHIARIFNTYGPRRASCGSSAAIITSRSTADLQGIPRTTGAIPLRAGKRLPAD